MSDVDNDGGTLWCGFVGGSAADKGESGVGVGVHLLVWISLSIVEVMANHPMCR